MTRPQDEDAATIPESDPFVVVFNELMTGRGISNNAIARQIDVDPAQVGRWRKGLGRPRPENLVRVAAVFGVDHTWLWSLAYPEGMPTLDGPSKPPRLAAFLAHVEAAYHAMTPEEWELRENAARDLLPVRTGHAIDHNTPGAMRRPRKNSAVSNVGHSGPDTTLSIWWQPVRALIAPFRRLGMPIASAGLSS